MRLERLVQKFDTRENLETLSYSVTELYSMGVVQLYTTLAPMHFEPIHLGGRGPLNPSGPLGLGRTPTGGGSRPLSYTESLDRAFSRIAENLAEEDRERRESFAKLLESATKPLTIRDFPASGFQMHIHEGQDGTAFFKDYSGKRIIDVGLSSYDAAMADLKADLLGINKLLRRMNSKV